MSPAVPCPSAQPPFYTLHCVPGPLSIREVLTPGGLSFPPPPLKSFEKHWLKSFIDFLELSEVLLHRFIQSHLFVRACEYFAGESSVCVCCLGRDHFRGMICGKMLGRPESSPWLWGFCTVDRGRCPCRFWQGLNW